MTKSQGGADLGHADKHNDLTAVRMNTDRPHEGIADNRVCTAWYVVMSALQQLVSGHSTALLPRVQSRHAERLDRYAQTVQVRWQ